MTVRDIVSEALRVYEKKLSAAEVESKVREVLQAVGLEGEILGRYPHEFSGGQRQRVAIARALALSPEDRRLRENVELLERQMRHTEASTPY